MDLELKWKNPCMLEPYMLSVNITIHIATTASTEVSYAASEYLSDPMATCEQLHLVISACIGE